MPNGKNEFDSTEAKTICDAEEDDDNYIYDCNLILHDRLSGTFRICRYNSELTSNHPDHHVYRKPGNFGIF